jgi:hypothetical protein
MLARLRHRPVRRRNNQNRPVHLRRAGDHVLHVIGMTRAVDVRVVPVRRLVLNMRRRYRDPPRLLFRRLVNLIKRYERRTASLRQHLRNRRRQCRLAMVNMTNRPNIAVRLLPLKFRLRHRYRCSVLSFVSISQPAGAGPLLKSAAELPRNCRTALYIERVPGSWSAAC